MSAFAIEYETGIGEAVIEFEFTPGKGTVGELSATLNEETFVAKVDVASARGRSTFVKEALELYPDAFTLSELDFRRALVDLAVYVTEEFKIRAAKAEEEEDAEDGVDAPEPGSERYDAAMEILSSEDVLEEAAKTLFRLGHVGEWTNKKLAFVCAISARAGIPVQPSTHAQSSAGKNYLWDNVLALVPSELVYKKTGFSAKALFRTKMSLKNSVLYIQELSGSEGADFSIRTLQSDNVLKWEATEKQPDGSLANVEYEVEGPTVIVQTTTRNHLHPENETRVVPLYLDESAGQTKDIIEENLRRAAGKGTVSAEVRETLCAAWHDAVRLLEPLDVIIQFAERIQVPSTPLRLRRDVPRLLNIIRLVTWLHQHDRERDDQGRVIATEADFAKAIEIVGDSFARAWKALTPSEEKVYEACSEHMAGNLQKHGFKRSHVETALRKSGESLSLTTVKDCLYTLARSGYLESDGKKGATGATYTLTRASVVTSTISLDDPLPLVGPAGHSADSEKPEEFGVGKANPMAGVDFGRSRPLAILKTDSTWPSSEWPNGREWPNGSRPLKTAVLQEEQENGRMAGKNEGGGGSTVEYEYSEDE
jgi:hypothetical protein